MEDLTKSLEEGIDKLDDIQGKLSVKWRMHSNRRSTIVLVVLGVILTSVYLFAVRPPDNFPTGELVTVRSGATLSEIADEFEAAGVVRSSWTLRGIVKALGSDRSIHAGDYLFREPRDVYAIARAISIGAFGMEPIRIRVPEGATARSMAIIFQSNLLRFNAANFLAQAQLEEGFLFPDTYFFPPNASEEHVIQTMRQTFDQKIEPYKDDIEKSGKSLRDIVTMASIIEREARIQADRHMISGVLWNRIDRDMALQVDVTFLYTLGKNTFQLTMKDLVTDSPYNTYVNKGLPPTPIGSPSLGAIEAALYPTENDYLFYLADNSGVTHFSKTYSEHLRKKRLYLGT